MFSIPEKRKKGEIFQEFLHRFLTDTSLQLLPHLFREIVPHFGTTFATRKLSLSLALCLSPLALSLSLTGRKVARSRYLGGDHRYLRSWHLESHHWGTEISMQQIAFTMPSIGSVDLVQRTVAIFQGPPVLVRVRSASTFTWRSGVADYVIFLTTLLWYNLQVMISFGIVTNIFVEQWIFRRIVDYVIQDP
jgi:hypothetical protein